MYSFTEIENKNKAVKEKHILCESQSYWHMTHFYIKYAVGHHKLGVM